MVLAPESVSAVDAYRRRSHRSEVADWGFNASGLDAVLKGKRISSVFFAGSDTSFCVESTVRGAIDCDYSAIVVEDACFSAYQQLHDSTMTTLGFHLAFFTTTAQVTDHYPWDRLPGVPHPILDTSIADR